MPQLSVYRNGNQATKAAFPLLLDVQGDVVSDLATRVVVPLCPASAMQGKFIGTLTPVLEIEGKPYAMLTPQVADVASTQLGSKAADLAAQRDAVLGALDLLITGI